MSRIYIAVEVAIIVPSWPEVGGPKQTPKLNPQTQKGRPVGGLLLSIKTAITSYRCLPTGEKHNTDNHFLSPKWPPSLGISVRYQSL